MTRASSSSGEYEATSVLASPINSPRCGGGGSGSGRPAFVVAALARAKQQQHEGQDSKSIKVVHYKVSVAGQGEAQAILSPWEAGTKCRDHRDTQSDITDLFRAGAVGGMGSACPRDCRCGGPLQSMPEQSDAIGSVFLSYASQDAEAAARICEALQTVGVKVWLDKSELRGGYAWDAKIKKRIHDCALFIPVISAHTNARSEGYFRGEWTLATRRLLNIAQDAAFLVPVRSHGTREADARVPDEFLLAQWTWLPNGETPPAFAHRVRQLLEGETSLP